MTQTNGVGGSKEHMGRGLVKARKPLLGHQVLFVFGFMCLDEVWTQVMPVPGARDMEVVYACDKMLCLLSDQRLDGPLGCCRHTSKLQ
ncbi:hypothetical protein EDB84DRAFT_1202093 [Lactarius hengduanensis]|nr:hypothetical protein EDB84DRAFT_1202093 [Lactarius hengduanensis]